MSNKINVRLNSESVLDSLKATEGTIGTFKGYPIQTVDIKPTDTILVHISDTLDLDDCRNIHMMLKEEYPTNTILLCNEHVLKGMTILRNSEKIDDLVSINTEVDIDKFLDEVLKGHKNDFLY